MRHRVILKLRLNLAGTIVAHPAKIQADIINVDCGPFTQNLVFL